jgi:DNA repair protein RadC
MRARVLRDGADALSDHELLEMLLYGALPRRDTKPIAQALIARFGSLAAVMAAPLAALRETDGLGEAVVAALRVIQGAAARLARDHAV